MEIIRFALLGLATGSVYAMLAQGLVLVYRGSGLLNFAQGAFAMFGAYIYYQLSARWGAPLWVGLIGAIVATAALGALVHMIILRPMRRTSALARVIATLGVLTVLQAGAVLIYTNYPKQVPSLLPTTTVDVFNQKLPIGVNYIVIFGVGLVLTVVLNMVYRRTRFGKVTSAVAENEVVAATLGHSPDRVAVINWAAGGAVAALAGVFISPIIYLDPSSLTLMIIPAVSAALIGEFASFPLTLLVALVLGVANSEILRYVSQPGWASAAPFIAIVVVLVVRGRGLPLRSFVLERLPAVGSGRVPIIPVLVAYAVGVYLVFTLSREWDTAITTTLASAIICLSVVVVTGYAGQLSLAQAVLAGLGAFAAAHLDKHLPFVAALLVAAAITAVAGAVIGLPALRTRGITLAIVTLGLGGAVAAVIFGNLSWAGGGSGIPIATPSIFGWNLDPFFESDRYGFVVLTVLTLLALLVANMRRGVVGRRLVAVRSNERAAAALGVNIAGAKLYAFTLGAILASIGGTLLAFQQTSVVTADQPTFDVLACILVVGAVVVAGAGSVGGALFGSLLLSGGITTQIFSGAVSLDQYLPLAGGVLLILTLIFSPDGIFEVNRQLVRRVMDPMAVKFATTPLGRRFGRPAAASPEVRPTRVRTARLRIDGLGVRYGGVHAVEDVTLEIRPGKVHGILGPNGAGKTTLIDAITGFTRVSSGTVTLNDEAITGWSARRRARAGVTRSFQSLELFDDLSVMENLAVAGDRSGVLRYLLDLFRPGRIQLNEAAHEALRQFELLDIAAHKPSQVSLGRRKTVAIARAVASSPSVLLLDEPAAGLDDQEAAELARLIRLLADDWGIAILLVEHKIDLIMSISDYVSVLDGGRLLTAGPPSVVAEDRRVHAAYLGDPDVPTAGEGALVSTEQV